jgi:hypothetical protein
MPSVLTCPSCERRLNVPASLVGEKVQCPTCGATFLADLEAAPPRPAAEPVGPRTPPPVRPGEFDEAPPHREEDDEAEDDRLRRRGSPTKPDKVQAIGVMMLIGGILGVVVFLGLGAGSGGVCCLWPGSYYSLVMGIFAIVKGAALLGDQARLQEPPRGTAVMMIVNVLNLDFINLALGIVCLVFLNEPGVQRYFRR